MKLLTTTFLSAFFLTALSCAPMNTPVSAHETGRYTLLETKEGVLRLDKRNGNLDTCSKNQDKWECKPIDSGNEAYKPPSEEMDAESGDTISALRLKNLKLKQRIADLEAKQTPGDLSEDETQKKALKLPSEEEVDEAISYMEKMIRKFRGAMKRLHKEEQNNPPGTEL
ncbi:MAG: hypothetical protein DHS20C08_21370 [Rhodomicrobium sp.]|nr:MAG: hypothetical protein DHS20C08_21370 [Rhodomicrobium sp.]